MRPTLNLPHLVELGPSLSPNLATSGGPLPSHDPPDVRNTSLQVSSARHRVTRTSTHLRWRPRRRVVPRPQVGRRACRLEPGLVRARSPVPPSCGESARHVPSALRDTRSAAHGMSPRGVRTATVVPKIGRLCRRSYP